MIASVISRQLHSLARLVSSSMTAACVAVFAFTAMPGIDPISSILDSGNSASAQDGGRGGQGRGGQGRGGQGRGGQGGGKGGGGYQGGGGAPDKGKQKGAKNKKKKKKSKKKR